MPSSDEQKRPEIIEALADLLQLASDWVRQEAETTMHDKVVMPLQRVGLTIASASASGCALILGLIFVAVALFMWLGGFIGYPWAFFVVGMVYVAVSAVFLYIKVRLMQR
jgi:hypothetical protein